MRSPTKHLTALRRSLAKAEKIVASVDPVFPKTDLQKLKIRSYVLLSHAAIEEYMETLVLDVALSARQIFLKNGRISHALVALISSKLVEDIGAKSKNRVSSDLVSNIDIFSQEAYNRFRDEVFSNHGIKEKNLMKMFHPIGVCPETEDSALMSTLNAFGSRRGDIAHSFIGIQSEPNLKDTLTTVRMINQDIVVFDRAACATLRANAHVIPSS